MCEEEATGTPTILLSTAVIIVLSYPLFSSFAFSSLRICHSSVWRRCQDAIRAYSHATVTVDARRRVPGAVVGVAVEEDGAWRDVSRGVVLAESTKLLLAEEVADDCCCRRLPPTGGAKAAVVPRPDPVTEPLLDGPIAALAELRRGEGSGAPPCPLCIILLLTVVVVEVDDWSLVAAGIDVGCSRVRGEALGVCRAEAVGVMVGALAFRVRPLVIESSRRAGGRFDAPATASRLGPLSMDEERLAGLDLT